MLNKKNIKWGPPGLLKRPDNIISSEARARNDNGFQPSYNNAPNAIGLLLSNEYHRQWFKERAVHEKELFSMDKKIVQLKRRFVQKMMTYKPSRKIDIIEDKLKEKRREIEIKNNKRDISPSKPDYTKIKYKVSCMNSKLKSDSKETKSVGDSNQRKTETESQNKKSKNEINITKSKNEGNDTKTKIHSREKINNKSTSPKSKENITEEGECC